MRKNFDKTSQLIKGKTKKKEKLKTTNEIDNRSETRKYNKGIYQCKIRINKAKIKEAKAKLN